MNISTIRGMWCGLAGAANHTDTPAQSARLLQQAIALTNAHLAATPTPAVNTLCTMPLGLLYPHSAAHDLRETILTLAVDDPAPYLAAAYLMALASSDRSVEAYLREMMTVCDGLSIPFDRALLRIGHVLGWGSRRHALRHLYDDNLASAVAIALYAIVRHPDDPAAMLDCVAASPGHHAEVSALTAAYIGTRDGQTALPQAWQTACDASADWQPLVERMAAYQQD